MALSSFGIRFRIFGGSAVLVGFSLVLAGFGIGELTSIDSHVAQLVTLADASTRAVQVGQLIERTGRLALHYKATGNPASMDGSSKAQAAARALLQEAVARAPPGDRRQASQAIESSLVDYQKMWESGATLAGQTREERVTLLALGEVLSAEIIPVIELVNASHDTSPEQALGRTVEAMVTSVAALRIAGWRFLNAPDAPGAAAFASIAGRTGATLVSLAALDLPGAPDVRGGTQPLIGQVKKTLDAYAASFAALSAGTLRVNDQFDRQMRPLVEDLVAKSAALEGGLAQDLAGTRASLDATIADTMTTQQVVGIVALALGSLLALLLGRSVIRPVAGMTVAMQKLAAGDTGVDIPSRHAGDEMGSMAKAVEVFRQNALDRIRLEGEQAEQERRAAQEKRLSMMELADAFEQSVGGIVSEVAGASTEVEKTARSMAAMAERASLQASTVARAATEATGNVRQVAAATAELNASIGGINQQVARSTQVALQAVEEAKKTDETVTGLADAARKIGDVVSLIQTIASQTNLLALNATIEAARAGEAGKGFAVVASEVKNLAGQTAKATQDIASQIAAIQSATAQAVGAIQGIGAKIAQMNEVSTSIATAIDDQGTATRAIAGSVGDATRGTESVSSNIAGVTAASTEVGAAAGHVLRAASGMSLGSARMKAEVASFLATLRAA